MEVPVFAAFFLYDGPMGTSMGRDYRYIYLYMKGWLLFFNVKSVCKYTSPINAMGV